MQAFKPSSRFITLPPVSKPTTATVKIPCKKIFWVSNKSFGRRCAEYYLACMIFLCFLLNSISSFSQSTTQYNVMFIAVDDMNEKAAVFGYPKALTPNLQRLASHGVVFKKTYCQFPLCNPSRTSL